MSPLEPISASAALVLLSMRLVPSAVAIIALIIVLPCMLFLLGAGAVVRWIWRRLQGPPAESSLPLWRSYKWAVLGLSGLAWLALTVMAIRAPAGPAPESAAVSNLRTINTAEVTYLAGHDGHYSTIPDLITAGLLDSRFEREVSGYLFEVTVFGSDYTATAMPASREAGKYGYYSGPDPVIRYAGSATETCTPCFPEGMSRAPVQ